MTMKQEKKRIYLRAALALAALLVVLLALDNLSFVCPPCCSPCCARVPSMHWWLSP